LTGFGVFSLLLTVALVVSSTFDTILISNTKDECRWACGNDCLLKVTDVLSSLNRRYFYFTLDIPMTDA